MIAYARLLILEKVSMVCETMVEILDAIAKFWWPQYQNLPFGGIVMVFVRSGTCQNPVYLFENKKWTTKTSKGGLINGILLLKSFTKKGILSMGHFSIAWPRTVCRMMT